MAVEQLTPAFCELGEGPVWEPLMQRLYWTDITGQRLWSWAGSDEAASKGLVAPAGALVRGTDGSLAAPMNRGFAVVDPATGAARALGEPRRIPANTLMNDGACDPSGALVAGAKHLAESEPAAAMMRFDCGGCTTLKTGFTVFNGPAFSPGGTRIYYTDSPSRRIWTAAYDPAVGSLGMPELFAELGADEAGYPDGMTVDTAGGLWNARFDGWAVARYTPGGELDRLIQLPVPRVTAVTFGGADLTTLFITTARIGLSEAALAEAPQSGALFAERPGETGQIEPIFGEDGRKQWT